MRQNSSIIMPNFICTANRLFVLKIRCWSVYTTRGVTLSNISFHLDIKMTEGLAALLALALCTIGMVAVDATSTNGANHFTIVEEHGAGTLVHNITECSQHSGSNVYMYVYVEDGQSVFDMYFDTTNAVIVANRIISRDDIATRLGHTHQPVIFEIHCTAYDILAEYAVLRDHSITLEILDLNNHEPRFMNSILNLNITERDDDDGFHSLRLAEDIDQGVNSTQTYYLQSPLPESPFSLDVRRSSETNLVTSLRLLIGALNREVQSNYELVLIASENSTNPNPDASLAINITVLDVCDESPMFPMSRFQASVMENSSAGTTVLTNVTAMDRDILDEGQIRYRISSVCSIEYEGRPCILTTSPFRLDHERGDLTLVLDTDDIDREEFIEYEVSIIAEDSCRRATTATVEVTIGNINDNPPVVDIFGSNNVPETQLVNSTILFLEVRDLDYGRNRGPPPFSITMKDNSTGMLLDTDVFYLHSENDRLVLKLGRPLDREERSSYSLVLNTTDWESPNMSTITHVMISVDDVNDNSPVFDIVEPRYLISEGPLIDVALVTHVTARDRDSVESGNGNVTYSLPPSNSSYPYQNYLRVEENGDLVVAESLDREEQANFSVLVKAQDNPTSGEPRTDYVIIYVELIDINDNVPTIISPPDIVEIPETEPTGSVAFTVFAYDNDTEQFSNVTYSMTPTNSPFEINSISGRVTLVASLDYETSTSYSLMVHATDQTWTSSKNVTVQVQNINDERCIFNEDAIYSTSVNESAPSSFRVFTVHAADRDTPPDQLRFSIVGGNKNSSFLIDPSTGEIQTTRSLDNEAISNYTLIIQCSDGSPFPTTVPLVIQVLDINDNPPRFDRTMYSFMVSENLPEQTFVGSVHAEDYDSGSNGAIQYNLLAATPQQAMEWFRMDPQNGRIVTTQPLDRENSNLEGRAGLVRLTIQAIDMPTDGRALDAFTMVFITITDRNDNRPIFQQRNITITLAENVIQGTDLPVRITAIDIDSSPYNTTNYLISGSYPEALEIFDLQMSTGVIRLRRPLDYEAQARLEFVVQAIDANAENLRDSQLVIINVLDVPEKDIRFNNFVTSVQVQENSPVNYSVTKFGVTDKLGTLIMRNFVISFTIIDTSTNTPSQDFGLMNDSYNSMLIVYVKRNIDRETLPQQNDGVVRKAFNITASSAVHGSVSAILTITILDDNDNYPIFSMPSYTFDVEENNDISVSIGTVSATDSDFGTNGSAGITYQVNSPLFQVAVDGELTSTESLDFEMQQSYDLEITASDGGSPPKTSHVPVRVNVRDMNDNSPVFYPSNNHTFYIGEETPINSVVAELNVADLDSGRFGEVNVSIGSSPSQDFEIAPNGSIRLVRSLDQETVSSHYFTVVATDGGGLRSTAEITVVVEDFNDNKPVFNPISTIFINETQPEGVVFATITASDDDIGPNSIVRYAIGDFALSQTFCIDEVTGGLSLCNQHAACDEEIPNYEHRMRYILSVVAYDLGTPRNIVSQNVTILVNPVNEHPPMFDRSLLFVYINETRKSNVEIARISAVDVDEPEMVSYQVLGTDRNFFRYDQARGAVVSNGNLDYNVKPSYDITLRATDSGSRTSSVNIIILVVNINDHPPVFDQSTLPSVMAQPLLIKESTPVSTVVWRVQATDEDDLNFDAVRYHMDIMNDDMRFRIDALTGEIIINTSLDYEERSSYSLVIYAVDAGTPPLTSSPVSIWITVEDENDEFPIFNSTSYSFFVAEKTPVGTVIGSLRATDRDAGAISYSIADGINQYFDINTQNGHIFTLSEIDRDAMSNNVVSFTVHATDGIPGSEVHTAIAEVIVTITDVNDNAPILTSKQYLVSISPNQQVNVPISTTISSTDRDGSDNSQYHYEVEGPSSNLMINVTSSGQLILREPVPTDYQLSYSYALRAVDNNNNSLFSTASLELLVETDIDHHPRFVPFESVVDISELDPNGTQVFDVSQVVSDSDIGSNGQISYAFAQTYPNFLINSGRIVLNGMLDYESVKEYNLIVLATDSRPGSHRTAMGIIRVNVLPGNEFPPVFNMLPSNFTISYLPVIGLDLFTASAMDQDEGEDGRIEYSITDSSHYFSIDQQQGTVRNQGILERGADFEVIIEACDCGSTVRRTAVTIRISTRDPGAAKPVIAGLNPRSIIRAEDTPVNSLLNSALVTSPEAQTYHLVKQVLLGSDNNPVQTFSIIEAQGRLRLAQQLDYEEGSMYSLVVEARVTTANGMSETRASDFLQINFAVTNVNDNNPVFTPIAMQRFSEDIAVGSLLFQAEATDRDLGREGILTYDFCRGSTDGTFAINSTSGQVRLERPLDRETASSYALCIQATDHSNIPHSAEIEVHVKVLDVNDYVTTYGNRNYSLSVYEYPVTRSRTRVMKLSATDLDEGPPLKYRMTLLEASLNNNPVDITNRFNTFEMDPASGTISVGSVSLDRESVDRYLYHVTATDLTNTAETYLTIHILDVDDHAPELNVPKSSIRVIEGMPVGSLVTNAINVSDSDIGINSWVIYSLGSGWPGDYFRINPLSGVIRVNRQIVALQNASFDGEIIAEDQGSVKYRTRKTVTVTIQDVNDHPPMFESASITLKKQVGTTSADWTTLYKFNVTDEDFSFNAEPWMFQIPHYYDEARDNFRIGLGTGVLDIEPQNEVRTYNFRVVVSNAAFYPMCVRYMQASSINVTVEITPVNRGGPQFTQHEYIIEVTEGLRDFSQAITRIQATDVDGDSITFSLNGTETPFRIEPSGELFVSNSLDRETQSSYSLTILATDTGYPSKFNSSIVTVVVRDVNDNDPEFSQKLYTASVMEDSLVDTPVLSVTAEDLDLGANADISYQIRATDVPFSIHPTTGNIVVSGLLDYESKSSYLIKVIASDSGNPSRNSSAFVNITLTDVNEGAPTFSPPPEAPIPVDSNKGIGDVVYTVRATDPDFGEELMYSFVNQEPKCYFDINSRTGEITLKVNPDSDNQCSTQSQQSQSDPSYFIIEAEIRVSDGKNTADTVIDFSLHRSFGITVRPSSPLPIEIITASVLGVLLVTLVFVVIVVIACICRWKKAKYVVGGDNISQSIEMRKTFGSTRSHTGSNSATGSIYKQTTSLGSLPPEHTTMSVAAGSSTSSARQSYIGNGDSESGGAAHERISYHSPGTISGKSQAKTYRSTSDLGSSTMNTDILSNGSQEAGPYHKAQLERIYAKNADLLDHSGSNESIHMFGSEGGGESDGGDDLYAKFDDLDDDDDSTTMQDDDEDDIEDDMNFRRRPMPNSENVALNIDPVEISYGFNHDPISWTPRTTNMAETIDQIAYESEEQIRHSQHFVRDEFSKSQGGMSGYGTATQESTQPLLRHPHHHMHHQQQRHIMQQQPDFYYDDRGQDMRLHDDHHIMRGPPPNYSGPSAGLPSYSTHDIQHHPMSRHPGVGMGVPSIRGASQEVPPIYSYQHEDFMHHPIHHDMGTAGTHSPSSTPTEEALNTRNEYESDIMYSSDTSLNTNTESEQIRQQQLHQQIRGPPRGFSQSSQRGFSQTSASQRHAFH